MLPGDHRIANDLRRLPEPLEGFDIFKIGKAVSKSRN